MDNVGINYYHYRYNIYFDVTVLKRASFIFLVIQYCIRANKSIMRFGKLFRKSEKDGTL